MEGDEWKDQETDELSIDQILWWEAYLMAIKNDWSKPKEKADKALNDFKEKFPDEE